MDEKPRKVVFRKARVKDDPIPKSGIIKGRPKARTFVLHEEPDGSYACGIWHCTPGKFHWTFDVDEFVYFIEGEARVVWDDGRRISVKKGEAAYFPEGHTIWTISKTVRKVFVARS